MTRFRSYVLTAAGFAVLVMVVGIFAAGPAIAQAVRAALVSNVDDPGRIPYQYGGDCSFYNDTSCFVQGQPVPAGKRLVITHVSGDVSENLPGGSLILPSLASSRLFAAGPIHFPVAYAGNDQTGLSRFVFNDETLMIVDAYDAFVFGVDLSAVPSGRSILNFSVIGYMLDCTAAPCAAVAH